ncbi:MAG TPA: hypothetical protein VI540_07105 [Gaiellaceae bacterium]|nr:hypothetical protein [Gaiellaceae bacterium]
MSGLAEIVAGVRRELEISLAAEEERSLELTAAERYARDPFSWIEETPVWVASKFAEGGRSRPVRFSPFPGQRQTLEAWIDLELLATSNALRFRNLVAEKSRQIGETWLFAVVVLWVLHYRANSMGLALHKRSAEIDDGGTRGTVKSLFGKVRWVDSRLGSRNGLPDPMARASVPGLGTLTFRPFSREPAKIENPRNGATLYGEGQTDNPGRGDTYDYVLVDEAAFVEHGELVHAALGDACPEGKAYFSTVNGDSNMHARLADEKPKGWTYLRLHWSEHPFYGKGLHVAGGLDDCAQCAGNRAGLPWNPEDPKAHRYPGRLTSPWYDQAVLDKTDEQVANELDIDRERALSGRVYTEFQTDVHVVEQGIPFAVELESKTELAWDFGLDATSIVVCQDAPNSYNVVGILEMGDLFGTTATPELVSRALRQYLAELGMRFVTPDWTRRLYAIGDPSGANRDLATNRPLFADYRKQGFAIGRPPTLLTKTVDPSIRAVKRLCLGHPKPLRVCGVKAEAFARHMRNNVWPTDALGRRSGTRPEDRGEHNHACRAFAYLVLAKWGVPHEESGPSWDGDVPGEREGVLSPDVSYDMSL